MKLHGKTIQSTSVSPKAGGVCTLGPGSQQQKGQQGPSSGGQKAVLRIPLLPKTG